MHRRHGRFLVKSPKNLPLRFFTGRSGSLASPPGALLGTAQGRATAARGPSCSRSPRPSNIATEVDDDRAADAHSLYGKLEHVILPMFYGDRDRYVDVMRHAMALNGSFFNTERMVDQYVLKAYFQ